MMMIILTEAVVVLVVMVVVDAVVVIMNNIYYFLWHCSPARAMASSSTRFLDHTQRRATVGRTPLDE
jgi:hypothetical protein